jgi:hypothetical protein
VKPAKAMREAWLAEAIKKHKKNKLDFTNDHYMFASMTFESLEEEKSFKEPLQEAFPWMVSSFAFKFGLLLF